MLSVLLYFFFFFYSYGDHRDLHSFPTRRSSDLELRSGEMSETDERNRRWTLALGVDPDAESGFALSDSDRRMSEDRKSTRLNSSHSQISYAVFCLKKKKKKNKPK